MWKRVKDGDVDEFTDVTSIVQVTLTKLEETPNPTVLLQQKLQQFAIELEEFQKQVQMIGNTKKLADHLNSSRRNPLRHVTIALYTPGRQILTLCALSVFSSKNAMVSGNVKWLLMAAGTSTQVEGYLQEIQMLKNQSTMRISVQEGQDFWEVRTPYSSQSQSQPKLPFQTKRQIYIYIYICIYFLIR